MQFVCSGSRTSEQRSSHAKKWPSACLIRLRNTSISRLDEESKPITKGATQNRASSNNYFACHGQEPRSSQQRLSFFLPTLPPPSSRTASARSAPVVARSLGAASACLPEDRRDLVGPGLLLPGLRCAWPRHLGGCRAVVQSYRCGRSHPRSRGKKGGRRAEHVSCILKVGEEERDHNQGSREKGRGKGEKGNTGRKTYHKAKGKPRVRLDDVAAVVAAVVATADDTLIALDLLAERVLAAREDDTHGACFDGACVGVNGARGSELRRERNSAVCVGGAGDVGGGRRRSVGA